MKSPSSSASTSSSLEKSAEPLSPATFPTPDTNRPEAVGSPVLVVLRSDAIRAGLRTHTCPQCGVNPAGPPAKRRFQWVPPWVYLGLLANVIVLLVLYYLGRQVVDGTITLCADCARADQRGRKVRGLSVLAVIGAPALGGGIGAQLGDGPLFFGIGAGLVAGVGTIVAAHLKTKNDVILARNIDKKAGTLTLLAGPSFRSVVDAEAKDALP